MKRYTATEIDYLCCLVAPLHEPIWRDYLRGMDFDAIARKHKIQTEAGKPSATIVQSMLRTVNKEIAEISNAYGWGVDSPRHRQALALCLLADERELDGPLADAARYVNEMRHALDEAEKNLRSSARKAKSARHRLKDAVAYEDELLGKRTLAIERAALAEEHAAIAEELRELREAT